MKWNVIMGIMQNFHFTFHLSPRLCPSTAGCSPPSVSSIVFCLLLSCFTFHLGFVHPLQDVALHQCLPLSSVFCSTVPGGSLLPCYVVLPSSAWSSPWSPPSPWLPLCAAFGPPIVLHSCSVSGPSPLLFLCVFCYVNYFCSFPDFWVWCFILSLQTQHFPLHCCLSGSVCLSIVYWETMCGSHRSVLARHIGPLFVFWVK